MQPSICLNPDNELPPLETTWNDLLAEQAIRQSRIPVYRALADMRQPLRWKPEYETRQGIQKLAEEYRQWQAQQSGATLTRAG